MSPSALLQHLSLDEAIQLGLHKVVDSGQFLPEPPDTETYEGRKVKGRPLTALLEQLLVLDFIAIEVVGQTVEAVDVVFALEQNTRLQQPGNPAVAVTEGMNGYQKEVGQQRFDHRMVQGNRILRVSYNGGHELSTLKIQALPSVKNFQGSAPPLCRFWPVPSPILEPIVPFPLFGGYRVSPCRRHSY